MDSPFEGVELEIDYPCAWAQKIVGRDEGALRRAVQRVLGDEEYQLVPSRQSRTGKYVSLELGYTARDEPHRHAIAQGLHEEADVLFVL